MSSSNDAIKAFGDHCIVDFAIGRGQGWQDSRRSTFRQ
jgi:hypothetical protein